MNLDDFKNKINHNTKTSNTENKVPNNTPSPKEELEEERRRRTNENKVKNNFLRLPKGRCIRCGEEAIDGSLGCERYDITGGFCEI